MESEKSSIPEFFSQYPTFKSIQQSIGIDAEDIDTVEVSDSTIEGFDTGIRANRVGRLNLKAVILKGTGNGVRSDWYADPPEKFVELVRLLSSERTRGFQEEQLNGIIDSLDRINNSLNANENVDKDGTIGRGLQFIGKFFEHSANITQVISSLALLYPYLPTN